MAGMSNDQTEAAIITPDAKPNSDFRNLGDMSFFMKKTKAAPSMVPNKGINKPMAVPIMVWSNSLDCKGRLFSVIRERKTVAKIKKTLAAVGLLELCVTLPRWHPQAAAPIQGEGRKSWLDVQRICGTYATFSAQRHLISD